MEDVKQHTFMIKFDSGTKYIKNFGNMYFQNMSLKRI